MKRIVWTFLLLVFAVGNNWAGPSSHLLQNSTNESSPLGKAEKNGPVKAVSCDLPSINKIDATKLAEDNTVKLALYDAVVSKKGIVRAKKTCSTIEGDPVPVYATAKGGKIEITKDYSKDRYFKLAGLLKLFGGDSYTTRKVEIGYLDGGKFIPLNSATPPDGKRLFLRLKGKEFF